MPLEFFAWNSLQLIIALFIVLEVGTKLWPFDSKNVTNFVSENVANLSRWNLAGSEISLLSKVKIYLQSM